MRRRLRKLVGNERAATIIEFALVCPVMLILMMGLGELAFQGYLQSVLTGALQKAARDSSIEGNNTTDAGTAIDNKVKAMIGNILTKTIWDTSTRQNYSHFADVGPEYYWDNNPKNGKYDSATECFLDTNGNGVWDADPSTSGQGSANAVVVYQMGFTYQRLFPVARMFGWPATAHIVSRTLMKNQPYKYQNTADDTLVCPKGGKTS